MRQRLGQRSFFSGLLWWLHLGYKVPEQWFPPWPPLGITQELRKTQMLTWSVSVGIRVQTPGDCRGRPPTSPSHWLPAPLNHPPLF